MWFPDQSQEYGSWRTFIIEKNAALASTRAADWQDTNLIKTDVMSSQEETWNWGANAPVKSYFQDATKSS
ncbi:hypothetical protein GCM10008927_23570 [Amylibacter ulvae]|uniref:Uncharacterized protein n=1 Tax=Paramylibacter ulvae TaxID=1651968 RepID=A0ABQ3D4C3_9RHOB|nr:hypothetical protein GCM10008927_23570 [Amylibacter ulvae]